MEQWTEDALPHSSTPALHHSITSSLHRLKYPSNASPVERFSNRQRRSSICCHDQSLEPRSAAFTPLRGPTSDTPPPFPGAFSPALLEAACTPPSAPRRAAAS